GRGGEGVERPVVRQPVAALGHVARARRRPALGGVLRVRRTARARARAVLRRVTGAGRGPALDGARQEAVRRTIVADAVAALGDVADADGRTALGIALHVCGTRGVRARARLGHVADAPRGAADRPCRQERVGRAVDARSRADLLHVAVTRRRPADASGSGEGIGRAARRRPGAVLRHVARACRGAALRRARRERVGWACPARAVAELGLVAVAGLRAAERPRRQEGVGRAGGARSAAVLDSIAGVHRHTTDEAGGLEEVGRAVVADPVAALGNGAGAGRRPAHARLLPVGRLRVGRAGGARPGTRLVRVAGAGRGAAERARVARRVLASVACPVALIERARVAVARARRPRRLLRVGRAARAVARAVLGQVALAGRHAADGARRGEAVGGAGRARARAGLRHVADIGHGPADGARRLERAAQGAARPCRPVGGALIALLLGLDRAVAAHRQRRHRPAAVRPVVVEDLA